MSVELWSLFAAGIVMFVSISIQSLYLDFTSGLAYGMSNRETPPPGHGPVGNRLDRNVRNQIEGLALFVPLIAVAIVADISNPWTQIGAVFYVASRALFVPAFAFGLVPLRTAIWTAGFFALPAIAFGIVIGSGLG